MHVPYFQCLYIFVTFHVRCPTRCGASRDKRWLVMGSGYLHSFSLGAYLCLGGNQFKHFAMTMHMGACFTAISLQCSGNVLNCFRLCVLPFEVQSRHHLRPRKRLVGTTYPITWPTTMSWLPCMIPLSRLTVMIHFHKRQRIAAADWQARVPISMLNLIWSLWGWVLIQSRWAQVIQYSQCFFKK